MINEQLKLGELSKWIKDKNLSNWLKYLVAYTIVYNQISENPYWLINTAQFLSNHPGVKQNGSISLFSLLTNSIQTIATSLLS